MASADIPFIPFDPREVSPSDVFWSRYNALKEFCSENAPYVIIGSVLLCVAWWYLGIDLPKVPNWVWVSIFVFAAASPSAWILGKALTKALYSRETVLIAEVNAMNGDTRIIEVSPDKFERMTIRNQNDEPASREYLNEVIINGRRAYEVDKFNAEDEIVVASWQAGASNYEMRRERQKIDKIKTDLEAEANKALEFLATGTDAIREQGAEVANEIIRVAQGVENPNGEQLHSRMADVLEDNDPTEDLMSGESESGAETDGDLDLEEATEIEVDTRD